MNTVRQKCRPKHQVLVLKCYPRFQKGVQEVKPNSSELSYLLYYATTRRSKLQKVGAFLEKKTASDVWRNKLGNVQVTLQILTALIEKAPRDLPLYAGWTLTILDTVLGSKDINMIEESLPTFEAYCKHQDAAAAAMISERSTKYHDIVRAYASFASPEFLEQSRPPLSKPASIRWRTVGLRAIKAAVDSEGFGADSGKQLSVVLPVILDNLYSDGEDILSALQQKPQTVERSDFEQGRKRRLSSTTVTTIDTIEGDPLTAATTTADADKVAEEQVRSLAVRCLKQIFSAEYGTNRLQIRLATTMTLRFVASRKPPALSDVTSRQSDGYGNWATSLIETVARWTPVQDRFIIVVTAMESLIRSPVVEANLTVQLSLADLIDWLLSSDINMIGLSVMDVMLGFIQHILLVLQLGGGESKVVPHPQQPVGLDLFSHEAATFGIEPAIKAEGQLPATDATSSPPSLVRQQLLSRLQKCVGDLATHVYYTDQISDMVIAIFSRLRPSTSSDISTTAAAIEDPSAAATAIATSVNLQEDPSTDGFFSFATARVTALKAVKDVLVVANFRKSTTGPVAEARSAVGLNVWEGTQWLLRDEDQAVRFAYADALLTWLKLETHKSDSQIARQSSRRAKSDLRHDAAQEEKLAKRAVSNASRGEGIRKTDRLKFLQLLHLAIYENALENPAEGSNILLLHLILSTLVEKLGVNAARHGLPMIFRLQDDIEESVVKTAQGKVGIGSLVYGYLWAISEKFDFETTRIGSSVHGEISRRRQRGLWLEGMMYPPLPLPQISETTSKGQAISPEITSDSLRPFTNRAELVEEITKAYDSTLLSPPISPPTSPGKLFSVPTFGFGYGFGAATGKPDSEDQLPQKVKEELLSSWSKDLCIAAVERESAQTSSMTGSKTGASSLPRNYLSVTADNNGTNGFSSGANPPTPGPDHYKHHHDHSRPASAAYGLVGGLGSLNNLRRTSTQDGSPVEGTSSSSRDSTVRVNELKRVLSVNRSAVRHSSPLRLRPKSGPNMSLRSSDSESMVSYSDQEGNASVFDDTGNRQTEVGRPRSSAHHDNGHPRPVDQGKTATSSPSSQNLHKGEYVRPGSRHKDEDIPPVPKIPSSLNLPGGFPSDGSPVRPSTARSAEGIRHSPSQSQRGSVISGASERGRPKTATAGRPVSRKEKGIELQSWVAAGARGEKGGGGLFNHRADLGKLLAGIDAGGGPPIAATDKKRNGGLSAPPY